MFHLRSKNASSFFILRQGSQVRHISQALNASAAQNQSLVEKELAMASKNSNTSCEPSSDFFGISRPVITEFSSQVPSLMAREYLFLYRSFFFYIYMEAKCFDAGVLSLVPNTITCSCALRKIKTISSKAFASTFSPRKM
jgi:hypothetical protein